VCFEHDPKGDEYERVELVIQHFSYSRMGLAEGALFWAHVGAWVEGSGNVAPILALFP